MSQREKNTNLITSAEKQLQAIEIKLKKAITEKDEKNIIYYTELHSMLLDAIAMRLQITKNGIILKS